MKWLVLLFTLVVDALKIENILFEEYAMFGATVTMVCEYQVGESEYVDSIKWYKDNREFYRIVPHTSIEKDKVVTFNQSGVHLDLQTSGVSISYVLALLAFGERHSIFMFWNVVIGRTKFEVRCLIIQSQKQGVSFQNMKIDYLKPNVSKTKT